MIRRLFRWAIRAGAVVGGAAIVRRLLQRHEEPRPVSTAPPYATPPPQPTPEPAPAATPARPAPRKAAPKTAAPKRAAPKKAAPKKATTRPNGRKTAARRAAAPTTEGPAWVEPEAGTCPSTHPVKAKQSSGIFHLPGMQNYDRTVPDRCYVDAAAAEADGLRPAKR